MKPKKISFFGLFGQQNLGNDCTLQAILYHVHRYLPDAEIECVCTGTETISARYNIPTFPMIVTSAKVLPGQNNLLIKLLRKIFFRMPMELLHWVKSFKNLRDTYMLIVPGTGLLVDHTTGPFGYPYYVFKWSVIAKLCRCKLFIVSMGAGPIYHPLSRWFIKSALSLADYRSYRDNFSKQYINGIGFNTNSDSVYPDLAFSLPGSIMPECNNRDWKRLVIGIGLIDYYGPSDSLLNGASEASYQNYIRKLGTLINWFLENKYTVRVLIGDVKYDSSVKQDLLELIEKRGTKYEDGQFINEPIFTEEQLLPQIANTDVVISPRFHNIILALMLNKSVLSISYNEKFESLMDEFGLAEYCHHIDHFDVDRLKEQFIKLEKNAGNLKPYIKKKSEEYREALDKQYTIIFKDVWA